jgi:hypothetical protein
LSRRIDPQRLDGYEVFDKMIQMERGLFG